MKALAYIVLIGFVVVFLVLLILTCFCWKKSWDIGAAWKFFLHHWMKLQLVAFFALLAIYMPCCIKSFLHQLYKYAVSWDHELRSVFDDANEDSSSYDDGFTKKTLNENMEFENVKAFFLHNMAIFFIVHLVIFLVYIIVKIWDKIKDSANGSPMYKVLNYIEFSLLIAGFMIVHMQVFAFGFINIRRAYFDHHYFIFCFLIVLAYLIVFLVFWIFSFVSLLFRKNYLDYPENVNAFYFYLVGYKENNKWARAYDLITLIFHFFVGMMIGLLMFKALAQMIVILILLVVLFAISLLLRPWNNKFYLIGDLVSQLLILIVVIIFLIFQSWDEGSCPECGDREGKLCWIVVLLLFFALLLGLLFGLLGALWAIFNADKDLQEKIIVHEEENMIYNKNTNIVTNNYEQVTTNNMMTTNN